MEKTPSPTVLFDGVCNLCNAIVSFIRRHDRNKRMAFAELQSEAGRKILLRVGLSDEPLSSVLLIEGDRVYKKSSAILRISKYLPDLWSLGQIFFLFPPFLRDALYDVIARNRYRWFGVKRPSPKE